MRCVTDVGTKRNVVQLSALASGSRRIEEAEMLDTDHDGVPDAYQS